MEVHQSTFEKTIGPAILPALVIPSDFGHPVLNAKLLPVSSGFKVHDTAESRLAQGMSKRNIEAGVHGVFGIAWDTVVKGIRNGSAASPDSIRMYREILRETGLDWYPNGEILPVHGRSLISK